MNAISTSTLAMSASIVMGLWSQCALAQVAYSITPLGALGGTASFSYAVNDSGQVAGGAYLADGTEHAFLYSNGVMQDLGTLGGDINVAYGINVSGEVTGYSYLADNVTQHAFIYSNGVMQDIGGTAGVGINASGQVAGQCNGVACIYSNGVWQNLVAPAGFNRPEASAINDSGQVTGTMATLDGFNSDAFLYSNGAMRDLGPQYQNSYGNAINNLGEVAGSFGMGNSFYHAFLYSNGVLQDLCPSSGVANDCAILSGNAAINDYDQIVSTGKITVNGVRHNTIRLYTNGQLADPQNFIDVNDPLIGVNLASVGGIGNNGDIAATILGNSAFTNEAVLLAPHQGTQTSTPLPAITGTLGQNGWYVSKTMTLTWTVIGNPLPATTGCGAVSVKDTTGKTYTCTATQFSTVMSNSVTIKKDSGAAAINISSPTAKAIYGLNQNVIAAYTCTDATSGLASCSGTVTNGASISTSKGAHSFNVTATDNAGNKLTKSVAYQSGPPTATPVFSLKGGTYGGTQKVSITDAIAGAVIYYTTDGTTPTISSSVYGGAITVGSTETLKAVALGPTVYTLSAVRTVKYTIH